MTSDNYEAEHLVLKLKICDIVFVVSETGASSLQPSNRFQFPPPTGKEVHGSQLEPKNAKSPCFVLWVWIWSSIEPARPSFVPDETGELHSSPVVGGETAEPAGWAAARLAKFRFSTSSEGWPHHTKSLNMDKPAWWDEARL